jgi:DNA-binding transcriptional LysR family regulator
LACYPGRTIEADTVEATKRAVRAGAGVAAVSRRAIADELAAGTLRIFALADAPPMRRTIDVVRPEYRRPTPLEQAFEDELRAHLGAAAEMGDAIGDSFEIAMGSIRSSA